MTLSAVQKSALNGFSQKLDQFQQQLQQESYNVAQSLDPQSSNIITKTFDQSSVRGQASHAGQQRSGSSLSGNPTEQLQQMINAIQADIYQCAEWAREQVSQS